MTRDAQVLALLREAERLGSEGFYGIAMGKLREALRIAEAPPPPPPGWTVERYDDNGPRWSAWRDRDAADVDWWDDGDVALDRGIAEGVNGDELIAVLLHLQWLRSKDGER